MRNSLIPIALGLILAACDNPTMVEPVPHEPDPGVREVCNPPNILEDGICVEASGPDLPKAPDPL